MPPGNPSAHQQALHPAPGTSAAKLRPPESAAARPTDSEPAECASLADILDTRNHRPMLRLQALQIIEGVCRGLDHAHRNGSIHGDVQPEKIFVTSEGHVRLIGHGDAPTPAYASCEVLEGAPPVPADDLFSAACTGYQLLAGEPAFSAGNALRAEAAGQRPVRIPLLSPGQWRALNRALAFRRAERQPDIESFLDELRSQYPGQPENDATASMPGLPIAGMDEGRGRRLPAMAAGITVIAAILIALGWWLLRTPEAPVSIVPPAVASAEAETGLITRTEDASVIDSAAAMSQPQTENTQVPLAIPQSPATTSQPVPARQPANTQVIAVTTPPSATAIQPPPTEAFQPRTPEPVPADSAPAATRSEPEFTVTTLEAVSAAAKSPPVVVGPPRPATPLVPLLTPRALVPTLPVQTAPAISLPITSAADSGIYMVAFSSLKVRHYVDPDYPRNSEGIRTAGWVDVNFGIDELGHTTGLQVTGAEPAGLFEDAALSAVRRWRFFPAKSPPGSGQAVRSEVRVRFTPD